MEAIKTMIITWLTLFIIITLFSLIVSAYLMEENPVMSIPFIMIGIIFSILCTYGFWEVEWAVLYSDNTFVLESANYGEPYSYVFMFIFFVFFIFFIRAGWNMLRAAAQTKGEFTYTTNKDYFR